MTPKKDWHVVTHTESIYIAQEIRQMVVETAMELNTDYIMFSQAWKAVKQGH